MTHTLVEQMKEKAREFSELPTNLIDIEAGKVPALYLNAVFELIEQTHQATIEEVVKIAEVMKKTPHNTLRESEAIIYNQAISDLINAIK